MVAPVDINYLAVLAAGIVGFVIGMIWYSPALFGKPWMGLMGLNEAGMKEHKKGMGKKFIATLIASLVMSYVLAHVVDFAQAATLVEAVMAGFWTWLGFVATIMLGSVLWEGKPKKLYAINVGHYLVVLIVMAVILVLWV